MKQTYLITYKAYDANGKIIKNGQFRVKNQENELGAKINFEKFLEKKYPTFTTLVITECKIDVMNQFNDLFGMGNSNPFSKF
jgi:hypothetical protein